ncbi:MAG: flavodoxin family protein [Candidatus Paceibacterota bacterium]|jgi:multimeric flavodoxin WrbA
MKVCENCKLIYELPAKHCANCGNELLIPQKTDEYLMSFLEIDGAMLNRFRDIQKTAIEETGMIGNESGEMIAIGISGSGRDKFDMAAEESNSEFLLKECLKELEHLGAQTELIPLRKYNIKPCKACYSTVNTQCHFYCSCYPRGTDASDDMTNILYDKVLGADIIIFATPVNNFKISSHMALFVDRCISLDGSLEPADPGNPKNKDLNVKHMKFILLTADDNISGSGFVRRFIGKTAGIIATGHEEGTSMAISSLFMTLNHFGMIFPPWSNMYAMSSIAYPTFKDKGIVTDEAFLEDARKIARNTMTCAKNLKNFNEFGWKYDNSSN